MTRMHWMRWMLLAGLVAVCLFGAPAARAEGDFVTFGSQWWNQTAPEAKFQEYRDVPKGGFLETFLLNTEIGRNQFTLFGRNALQNDQATGLRWTNGVRLQFDMSYAETPHRFSFITKTPWVQVGPGVFVLPDSVQSAIQKSSGSYAGRMNDLLNAAPITPLGFQTDVSKARLRGRPVAGVQLEANVSRRERTGSKAIGLAVPVTGSGPSDGYEMPEPIDQRTVDAEVRANYQHRFAASNIGLSLQAIVGMSEFTNNISTLVFDNPKRLTDDASAGAALNRFGLYPDNKVLRGNLMLGLDLPHSTVFTVAAGISRTTQEQAFLPYTINSKLIASIDSTTTPGRRDTVLVRQLALPDSNLHGKAITRTLDMRLGSRLIPEVMATLRFRSYQYESQTPELVFPGLAMFDRSWTVEETGPDSLGNSNAALGLDVDIDALRQLKLGLSYELRDRKHVNREIARDTENWFAAKFRAKPLDNVALQLKGRYEHGKRHGSIDTDHMVELPDSVEMANLRRFDVANRTQNLLGAGASWTDGRWVDLSVDFSYARGTYPANDSTDGKFYGLTGDTSTTITLDGAFHATEQLDVRGGIGLNNHYYGQASHESSPNADPTKRIETDWYLNMRDKNQFWFLATDWRGMGDKLTATLSYEFNRDAMPITEQWAGPNASSTRPIGQLPDIFSHRHSLGLEVGYRVAEGLRVSARYGFEEYKFLDWQQQNNPYVNPATGTVNSIFMGNNLYPYFHAHTVALMVKKDL
jgi:MtrB/PioB family decaheme-associated outer membrane protein